MANPIQQHQKASYADLQAVPADLVAQIIEGELVTSPRPSAPHCFAALSVGADLVGPFQFGRGGGPGGWWFYVEPELHLGDDVLVPDLAAWRRERMAVLPQAASIDLAPDWVCEILSPSTASIDRVRKLRIYAREKITHAWLIDPLSRTLEVFRLEGANWLLAAVHANDEIIRAEPFDAMPLDLLDLWGETR